eukprot:GGOE01014099.1.p1 GENE.GGOE01014099.1~~GGOE01014099.1.p1  ORF type:complete len:411 (+),score=150.06 GGOE01014099.1:109-1341(+)
MQQGLLVPRPQTSGSLGTISLESPRRDSSLPGRSFEEHSLLAQAPPVVKLSPLLLQPSSAASFDDDAFMKLLLAENAKPEEMVAVRKGLADAVDTEECPRDLRSTILVDFLYDALQFCRGRGFSSLQTAACLKLLNNTRERLAEAGGAVPAVVPQFKAELFEQTRVRDVQVREVQTRKEVVREPVAAYDTGPSKKVKGRGRAAEAEHTPLFVERTVLQEVVSYRTVRIAPVFNFNDCVAIIDFAALTLFQHAALYAHVFTVPQDVADARLRLFVHDCFPPPPLRNALTAMDHEHWLGQRELATEEQEQRQCLEDSWQQGHDGLRSVSQRARADIQQLLDEREAEDRRKGLPKDDVKHAIQSLTYTLMQDSAQEVTDDALQQRLEALEVALARGGVEVVDGQKGRRGISPK